MRSLLLVLALATGCATAPRYPGPLGPVGRVSDPLPPPEPAPPAPPPEPLDEPSERSDAIAAAALYFLDHTPVGYRDDCSGYVCAVYARAGVPLAGNTAGLWSRARELGATHRRKRPQVGDL